MDASPPLNFHQHSASDASVGTVAGGAGRQVPITLHTSEPNGGSVECSGVSFYAGLTAAVLPTQSGADLKAAAWSPSDYSDPACEFDATCRTALITACAAGDGSPSVHQLSSCSMV